MNNEELSEKYFEEQIISTLPGEDKISSSPSDHSHAYRQEMAKIKDRWSQEHLKLQNIKHSRRQHRQFSYKIMQEFNNYQSVILEVDMGEFTFHIKVFNFQRNSPLSRLKPASQGTYGTVHVIPYHGQKIAIKSIAFRRESQKDSETISQIIWEYCVAKIADGLGCGPSLPACLGYDLIFYNDSVQFAMEQCQPLPKIGEQQYHQLLQLLARLHRFKLIHRDINPYNLMRSPKHSSLVFIDFGFSLFVGEEQGFKTHTSFHGTPEFVSKEMLSLLSVESKGGLVDLYYNDLICLQNTVKKLQLAELQKTSGFILPTKEEAIYENNVQSSKKIQLDRHFQLLFFHHQLLFNPSNAGQLILGKRVLPEQTIKAMLSIITDSLPSQPIEKMVMKELQGLSYLTEYQTLRKIIFRHEGQPYQIARLTEKQNEKNFSSRFSHGEGLAVGSSQLQMQLIQKLKDKSFFTLNSDKEQYYTLLLDCTRFDRKLLEIEVKIELAACYLEFQGVKWEIDPKDKLLPLRITFKIIVSFCLNEPATEWKLRNRFDALVQAILLDSDILQELSIIDRAIVGGKWDFERVCGCWIEHFFINNFYKLKLNFYQRERGVKIMRKVRDNLVVMTKHLSEVYSGSVKTEQSIISSICQQSLNINYRRGRFNPRLQHEIQTLKDSQFRCSLVKILLVEKLFYISEFEDPYSYDEIFQEAIDLFTGSVGIQTTSFIEKCYWNTFFLMKSSNNEYKPLLHFIQHTINCQQISSTVTSLLKMLDINSLTDRRQTIEDTMTGCFQDLRFDIMSSHFIIVLSILNQQQKHEWVELMTDKYFQFYQRKASRGENLLTEEYTDIERELLTNLNPCQFDQNDFASRTDSYDIYAHFDAFRDQYCEGHLEKYRKSVAGRSWSALQHYALSSEVNFHELNDIMEWDLVWTNLAWKTGNWELSFVVFKRRLQMFWLQVPIHYYQHCCENFMIVKNQIFRHQTVQRQLFQLKYGEMMENLIVRSCHFYRTTNRISYYLKERCIQFFGITKTLEVLWIKRQRYGVESFLFLKALIQELSHHPSTQKFVVFKKNMLTFYTNCPNFFHYQRLEKQLGSVTQENRYQLLVLTLCLQPENNETKRLKIIKTIALSIDNLCYYLKSFILQLYYFCILQFRLLSTGNARKRLFVFMHLMLPLIKTKPELARPSLLHIFELAKLSLKVRNRFRRQLVETLLKVQKTFIPSKAKVQRVKLWLNKDLQG